MFFRPCSFTKLVPAKGINGASGFSVFISNYHITRAAYHNSVFARLIKSTWTPQRSISAGSTPTPPKVAQVAQSPIPKVPLTSTPLGNSSPSKPCGRPPSGTSPPKAKPKRKQQIKKPFGPRRLFLYGILGGLTGYLGYSVTYRETTFNEGEVLAYRLLPLKVTSKAWGRLCNFELPEWARVPLLQSYCFLFGVNIKEAMVQDLKQYKNLEELFTRRLLPNVRPVDTSQVLVSPCDGKILYFGPVQEGFMEQVKGIQYSLPLFLGPVTWPRPHNKYQLRIHVNPSTDCLSYENSCKYDSDRKLFHCVVYIAPGDYHGFHSPADWTVQLRRHFPGELLSVSPAMSKLVRGLFSLNERAVYLGKWEHGFFSMTPVGATNVGNIKVFFDKSLDTNVLVPQCKKDAGSFLEELFKKQGAQGVEITKGEAFGEFRLGSSVVLIFEAPENFQFTVTPGQKIKYGESLGTL